jgi:sortase A
MILKTENRPDNEAGCAASSARLEAGDIIILRYADRSFLYKVERVFPVVSNDWSVIEPCGYPAITLTTCHLVGSAAQRLVVRAGAGTRA